VLRGSKGSFHRQPRHVLGFPEQYFRGVLRLPIGMTISNYHKSTRFTLQRGNYVRLQTSLCSRRRHAAKSARRGSTVIEYALLLAVIGCSVLFGARFIANSGVAQLNRLSEGPLAGAANDGQKSPGSEPLAVEDGQSQGKEIESPRSSAWQIGSLVLILGCGVAATAGLMMTRKKKEIEEEQPELVASSGMGRRTERFAKKRQDIYRVLCRNLKDIFTCNVRVEHILSPVPTTVLPTTPVAELGQMMKEKQFRHLLVCDQHETLLGVISDRDVAAAKGATAAEIMTAHPQTVESETDLRTAISVMLNHRFSSLPVVDKQRLVGIITVTDLIIMLQVTLQLLDKMRSEIEGGTLFDPNETADGEVEEAAGALSG
jgi:acetoin utilization protein AcuB